MLGGALVERIFAWHARERRVLAGWRGHWSAGALRAVVARWAGETLVHVALASLRVTMGACRARVSLSSGASRAVIALCANASLVLLLLTASVTDRTCLAIGNTPSIEFIVVSTGWASNDRLAFLTVATLGAGDQLKVCRARLTVVARWAVLACFTFRCAALCNAEFACWALGLDASYAI